MRQSIILILIALFSLFITGCDESDNKISVPKTCSGCESYQTCDTTTGVCINSANYCDADTPCSDVTRECDTVQHACIVKANACATITCSGHGTCDDSDATKVVCNCDSDYTKTADGLNCVAAATKAAKCAEYSCDDNGACELDSLSNPLCSCKEGFHLDGSDVHSCVENNTGGISAGELGDPCDPKENLQGKDNPACRFGICMADGYCSQSCNLDGDCGSSDYYCDKYLADSQGECKKMDPACSDLRTVDAYEACCGDSACKMGTLCLRGQCMPICLGDSECLGYAYYEKNQCGETDGNTGGNKVYCSASPGYYGFCEITKDACSEIKRDKVAFETCNSACGDADCMAGMRCSGGKCLPSCSNDATCLNTKEDTYCYLGVVCYETPASCVARSKKMWESCDANCSDADCPEGATCSADGICAPICSVGDSCNVAKDEDNNAYCNAAPGYYGNCERYPSSLVCEGKKGAYEACNAACGNLDCGTGMICSGDKDNTICLPKCSGLNDTTCSEGYSCGPVSGGFYCSKGVCWKGEDCPEGKACTSLTGGTLNDEPAIITFCKETTATKKYSEVCSANTDCISNFCTDGTCSKMCTGSDECTVENELCLLLNIQDDYDLPICMKADSSDAAKALNGKAFRGMCAADGGCPDDSTCYPNTVRTVALDSSDIEYICLGKEAITEIEPGTKDVGQSCTKDSQCKSTICYSRTKKCIAESVENGSDCLKDTDCLSTFCNTYARKCETPNSLDEGNTECKLDRQCKSDRCGEDENQVVMCLPIRKDVGEDCCAWNECKSGICTDFSCVAYCDTDDNCPSDMSCEADEDSMFKYCKKKVAVTK